MIGNIIYINDNIAHIQIPEGTPIATDMINLHILFEDEKKKILGEVEDMDMKIIKVRFLGEIVNGKFIGGVIRKPSLSAKIRVITKEEFGLIVGEENGSSMVLGYSPLYDGFPIKHRLEYSDNGSALLK